MAVSLFMGEGVHLAGFPDRKHQAAHRFTILLRQATVVVDQALFLSVELSGPQGCTDGGT
ncbi:hypothetical protein C7A12_13205 [Pseudomonas fluorescens]|nr:hypothetical protein C7A12_13205 [Pseudomonas fluorescens]PRW78731.1 hypothetical protein C7A13_12815 [Pseudomonas fluorescens]